MQTAIKAPVLHSKQTKTKQELGQFSLPNFLLIGAAKAGTTALYEFLRQHPQVYMPEEVKEPSFFTDGYGVDLETYIRVFKGSEGFLARGEASTQYVYAPESAAWIKEILDDVKIIAVLRDPAERAWSSYKWSIKVGIETACTFEEALALEPHRLRDESTRVRTAVQQFLPDYLHFQVGLYAEQVKRYLDLFSKEQVKFFLYEELQNDPLRVCREIFQFLNVDPEFVPKLGLHNAGATPLSIPLQFWLYNYRGRFELPERLNNAIKEINLRLGSKDQRPKNLLNQLRARYSDDIKQLENYLQRDLSSWYRME